MVILLILKALLVMFVISILILFAISWAMAWARAQAVETTIDLKSLISTAAVEWGGWMTAFFTSLRPIDSFYEAPPFKDNDQPHPRQIPILFVPSLHSGPRIFNFLLWRLKKRNCASLWIMRWPPFVKNSVLLQEVLKERILDIAAQTGSHRLNIVSFGTSRPILSTVIATLGDDLKISWVCISGPQVLSAPFQLIQSERLKNAYHAQEEQIAPQLLIRGHQDFFCYPETCFGNQKSIVLDSVGHYSALFHSGTVNSIWEEFQLHGETEFRHR